MSYFPSEQLDWFDLTVMQVSQLLRSLKRKSHQTLVGRLNTGIQFESLRYGDVLVPLQSIAAELDKRLDTNWVLAAFEELGAL